MKIKVAGIVWTQRMISEHKHTLSSWSTLFVILFVTFVFVYFTYHLFQMAKSNALFDSSKNTNSEFFCPEIDKKYILYPYDVASIQNTRPYQEDRYCTVGRFNGDDDISFYAIFDGHGGSKCSQFCATNLHTSIAKSINTSPYKEEPTRKHRSNSIRRDSKSGFLREMDIVNGFQLCDAKFKGSGTRDDGSTVVSAFLSKSRKQLITAHVGDSRAIMITENDSYDLTADHKPSNPSEKERVELLGGRIIQYGVLRVQGILAVTRALGDYALRPYVSNVPVVNYYELTGKECFLVMASDGLWDVMDHQEVAMLLHKCLLNNTSIRGCAQYLINAAMVKMSSDNITVMVIDLRSPQSTFGTVASSKWNEKEGTVETPTEETTEETDLGISSSVRESINLLEQTFNDF